VQAWSYFFFGEGAIVPKLTIAAGWEGGGCGAQGERASEQGKRKEIYLIYLAYNDIYDHRDIWFLGVIKNTG
jgi:hypothetical protein